MSCSCDSHRSCNSCLQKWALCCKVFSSMVGDMFSDNSVGTANMLSLNCFACTNEVEVELACQAKFQAYE